MKYTKEIPTKPGWYWVRENGSKVTEGVAKIAHDSYFSRNYMTFIIGPDYLVPLAADNRFEYAGPIEEPEE